MAQTKNKTNVINQTSPAESGIYEYDIEEDNNEEEELEANYIDDPYDDDEDTERLLAKELEEFQRHGLMTERHLDNVSPTNRDGYGEEAMQRYPQFFRLIPQNPHYRGLLQENVDEEIKRSIYLSLWYNLVDLTEKALLTDCSTDRDEIEKMIFHARSLGRLGFDVRRVIARLKQPIYKIYDLEVAKKELVKAKKRKYEAEQRKMEVVALESRVEGIKKELHKTLSELVMKKEQLGSEDKQVMQMKRLREEVSEAEVNLKAVEIEVGLLGHVES